ncbi:ABC transporter permease [Candidatus Sumerlaeota bacterium]|nr:ABC transporter permease [Candidatus Sumerlaeota bacterium]
MRKELGIFILLVVLCTLVSIMNPRFISGINLSNIANLVGMFGIFSIGVGLVIITGGIDLSVGSTFALAGVLLAMALREWNVPWPVATILIVLFPMTLGAIHGFLVTVVKMQAFIVTLCGLLLYRGLAQYVAGNMTKGFGSCEGFETLKHLASGRLYEVMDESGKLVFPGVPNSFILLIIIAVIMWIVLHRSVYGRYVMAVGRNEEAARYSGISTRLVIASTYIIAGVLTGISAVLFAFYTNSVTPSTHGNFYELYGIAAAVLGGCSLRGGEGSVIGIIIGAALIQILQNFVNLLGIPSSLNFAVMGAVILLGVMGEQSGDFIRLLRKTKLAKSLSKNLALWQGMRWGSWILILAGLGLIIFYAIQFRSTKELSVYFFCGFLLAGLGVLTWYITAPAQDEWESGAAAN